MLTNSFCSREYYSRCKNTPVSQESFQKWFDINSLRNALISLGVWFDITSLWNALINLRVRICIHKIITLLAISYLSSNIRLYCDTRVNKNNLKISFINGIDDKLYQTVATFDLINCMSQNILTRLARHLQIICNLFENNLLFNYLIYSKITYCLII